MPFNYEWQSRIKTVEREYLIMNQAADRFQRDVQLDPTIVPPDMRHRDIAHAARQLEGTYFIRLFAEFETGSRQFWKTQRDSDPRMSDLLDALAARCGIPHAVLENGHLVREYRNSLVHEREDSPQAFSLATARGHLCRFFSRLPEEW